MANCLRAIFTLLIASLIWACDKDAPSNIAGPGSLDSIPYRAEAEDMALFYSGQLHPPEYLVRQISQELWLLRKSTHDTVIFPERMTFQPPWGWKALTILFDSINQQLVLEGNHQQWNAVCSKYGLKVASSLKFGSSVFFNVMPDVASHPVELAKLIHEENVTGLVILQINPRPSFADYGLARIDKGMIVNYYVYDVIHPDLLGKYYFGEIQRSRSYIRGTHQNFPNNPDSILRNFPPAYFESLIDSLERNRPIWVDSARYQIGIVINAPLFQSLPLD